jgi:hypothetical protein
LHSHTLFVSAIRLSYSFPQIQSSCNSFISPIYSADEAEGLADARTDVSCPKVGLIGSNAWNQLSNGRMLNKNVQTESEDKK